MCHQTSASRTVPTANARRVALLSGLFAANTFILLIFSICAEPTRFAMSCAIAATAALACGIGLVFLPTPFAAIRRSSAALRIAPPTQTVPVIETPSADSRVARLQHLFEFSQAIQGAGHADQVFASLAYYLQSELSLAGLTIFARDENAVPSVSIKASFPENLMRTDRLFSDADCSQCPAMRQNLPKQFKSHGCPVRCSVDECITLGTEHSAYCIPFSIGRQTQVTCHLMMPPNVDWTDDSRQLAQTYINTAAATLVSLHLLNEAEKQSMTDPLTQLFNRRSMDHLLAREVALSERHGNPLSLVMIDMDHFKQINDAHGHAAGDHLLKAFADCVRITLRKTDLPFRYGGDEFVIVLTQTSSSMAQQCVQKLRQAFAAVDFETAIAGLKYTPTLSVGVVERSKEYGVLSVPQLLAAADLALYDAKAANRNCVKIFTPPQQAA